MPDRGDYRFYAPGRRCRDLAGGWLKLGVATLLTAGVYAALLAVARTPVLKDLVPSDDFFYTSLVIHVIFSNVFWFLAMAGVLWSLNAGDRLLPLGRAALSVACIGVAVIALSPFMGAGDAVMSNYIPFLDSPIFFAGLAISGSGFALLVLRSVIAAPGLAANSPEGCMRFGAYAAANAALMAILAYFWAFFTTPGFTSDVDMYQGLFWLGGHVLQFTHALLMLVAWIWLASASGVRMKLTPRTAMLLFTLALLTVAFTPVAFLSHNMTSIAFQRWFTMQMQIGGAVATLPLGLAVLVSLFRSGRAAPEARALRIALLLSMLLFALGGALGFMLRQSSTLVTAHYHSVTGAVTLAFMALAYDLLPHLGFKPAPPRQASLQAYAYGIGQLLHVLGLAWAGGYGMARKVAGSGQSLDNMAQTLGMSLMGLGGLIATIGGILFLIIVINAMRGSQFGSA